MQERFGGAMKQMSQTVPGLMSNIAESIAIVGSEAGEGLYEGFRGALKGIAESLDSWINVVRAQGIGGLFEHVIPPEFHDSIRQAMANVSALASSFMMVWSATEPFRLALTQVGLLTLNLILPVLQMATNVLAGLTNMMFSSSTATRALVAAATGMFIFYGIQKALTSFMSLKIVTWLMSAAQSFMVAARSGGIFAAVMQTVKAVISGGAGIPKLIGLVAGLGGSLAAVNAMFGKTGAAMGSMMGNNKDNYLQPVQKDTTKEMDAFNNAVQKGGQQLDKTGKKVDKAKDKTEKLGKAAKKAGKDAKDGLASFDEVFTLPENKIDDVKPPSTGAGKPEKPGISLPDLGDIGGIMPDLGGVGAWGDQLQGEIDIAIDKVKFPSSMRQEFTHAWDEISTNTRGFFETLKGVVWGGLGVIGSLFSGNTGMIKHKWVQMYSDMNQDTTKALGILKRTTDTGLNKVNDTWDLAMGTLPDITKEDVNAAALIFTGALKNMDSDSIQILKGTSSSMAHLFHNIRTDMTKEEAMKTFSKNIENMRKSGLLSGQGLEKDLTKAMATINKNVKSYSERTKSDAENIFGALESNISKTASKMAYEVSDAAKEMNEDSIGEMKKMGGTMSELFDGIEADSDFTSQTTRDKVTKNIEKMKENGTLNVDKMKTEFAKHMKSIEENSSKQMNAVKETVRTQTFDAAKFAGSNARQIEENMDRALSEIPGMSRDHMNEAKKGMVKQLEQAGVITKAEAADMTRGIVGEAGKTKKGIVGAMEDAKNWLKNNPDFLKHVAKSLGSGIAAGVWEAVKSGVKNTVCSPSWWINTALSGLKGALRMALGTILPDSIQDAVFDAIGLGRSRSAGRSMGYNRTMAQNVMGMGARTSTVQSRQAEMTNAFSRAIGSASEAGVLGSSSGGGVTYNVTVNAPGLRGSDQASLDRMARELKVAFEREDNRTFSGSNTRQAGGIIYG